MNIIAQRLKKELKMLENSQIFHRFIFELKNRLLIIWYGNTINVGHQAILT